MKLKDLIKDYGDYDVVVSRRIATNEIVINGRESKQKSVWDLKDGDPYYLLNSFGGIDRISKWKENNGFDLTPRELGNIFLTREDAEKDFERRIVENLLLKYGGRRWLSDSKKNWLISYDRELDEWRFLYSTRDQRQGAIYFDTKEEAEKAVQKIGEKRLKWALFKVK